MIKIIRKLCATGLVSLALAGYTVNNAIAFEPIMKNAPIFDGLKQERTLSGLTNHYILDNKPITHLESNADYYSKSTALKDSEECAGLSLERIHLLKGFIPNTQYENLLKSYYDKR